MRTVSSLLRKALVGLPPTAWSHFLPELQYTINATFHKATKAPPYLLMFGAPPPPLLPALQPNLPSPTSPDTPDDTRAYGTKLSTYMEQLHQAARKHHIAYTHHAPKPPAAPTSQHLPLVPGDLALVLRPRRSKLLTLNSGPYVVISI